MSTVAKILVVLNLGLAAVFLGSAANFLGQQDNWKREYDTEVQGRTTDAQNFNQQIQDRDQQLQHMSRELTTVQAGRDKALGESARLDTAYQQMREAYAQIASNLTLAHQSLDAMTKTIDSNRTLIDSLQSANNQLRDNLVAAQEARDAAVQMRNSLEVQLEKETENRKNGEQMLAEASEQIERLEFRLEAIAQRFPGLDAPEQPSHEGRILTANNSDNVYVISLGGEDGVKEGFKYIVSRGPEYVATIQIEDVEAKLASGRALRGLSKGQIQQGDKVMSDR